MWSSSGGGGECPRTLRVIFLPGAGAPGCKVFRVVHPLGEEQRSHSNSCVNNEQSSEKKDAFGSFFARTRKRGMALAWLLEEHWEHLPCSLSRERERTMVRQLFWSKKG